MIGDNAIYLFTAVVIATVVAATLADLARAGRAFLARIRGDDWRARYNQYIHSPEWDGKRRRALARAGHKCENCGSTERLEVHHLNYERLTREKASDLKVLCDSCHEDADRQRAAVGRAKRATALAVARARGLARWRRKHA